MSLWRQFVSFYIRVAQINYVEMKGSDPLKLVSYLILDDWRETLTRYGRCQVFNPDKDRFTTKITYGRGATMAFSIVYNDSDHTIGWFPFLSGLTLFYSGKILIRYTEDKCIII